MNNATDELALAVLKKPLGNCSLAELKQITVQFPWFAPAQLLYAKKLQVNDTLLYEEQVQRASLFFPNRLWLQHLLDEKAGTAVVLSGDAGQQQAVDPASPLEADDPDVPDKMTASAQKDTATEIAEQVPNLSPAGAGHEEEATNDARFAEQPAVAMEESEIPEANPQAASSDQSTENNTTSLATETGEQEIESLEDIPDTPGPAMHIPAPLPDNSTTLSFEPYHTVDYFASQGIKAREDDKPVDRFGQQLRSFTEWLKTLKKVPGTVPAPAASADPANEKKVEQLAEHSLAERHIVTEAMAEVWVKQGNKDKAVEIYHKLSLLDPSKTAYFAAKIEDLKKTS